MSHSSVSIWPCLLAETALSRPLLLELPPPPDILGTSVSPLSVGESREYLLDEGLFPVKRGVEALHGVVIQRWGEVG